MEVSSVLHMVAALFPEKELLGHIGEGTGWAPVPVWMLWITGRSLSCHELNHGLSAIQTLAYFPYFVKGEQLTEYEFLRRSKKLASFCV